MKIFLSYRRDDAAGHAGRLRDDLLERLGEGSVFQDVASIAPGQRYRGAIDEAIHGADLILIVIGRRWATVVDERGNPRLGEPHDVVRREVEAALRSGRQVVPVLVDGADMPSADALPAPLVPLCELNAIELRDEAWNADLDRMGGALGIPEPGARRARRRAVLTGTAVLGIGLLVVAGLLYAVLGPKRTVIVTASPSVGATSTPTSTPVVAAPSQRPEPMPADSTATTTRKVHRGVVRWLLVRWWRTATPSSEHSTVTLEVKVQNDTDDTMSVYEDLFHLRAGGIDQGTPRLGAVEGHDAPGAGEANVVRLQYTWVSAERPLVLLVGDQSRGRITLSP